MKDVLSINEIYWVNEILGDLNEWLVEHEGYEDDSGHGVVLHAAMITLTDQEGKSLGSFTKYEPDEDVKWEPDFVPDLVEIIS